MKRIARGRDGEERVCPIVAATTEKSRAGIFREHLGTAKVDAPAFFVETATRLMIDFRSLRDSGITWRFLAEHRAVVQREAGHEHIKHHARVREGSPRPARALRRALPGAF